MDPAITEDQVGCWLGGHMGWHNTYRVIIEYAVEYGFPLDDDDKKIVDVYRISHEGSDLAAIVGYLRERLGDAPADEDALRAEAEGLAEVAWEAVAGQGGLSDKATEYLNSLAPEGYAFNWDDGLSLLCLCQIEGTEENEALMKSSEFQCERCKARDRR